jgi:colanic acid/amylovoran biosynthesis glycosyltransferase
VNQSARVGYLVSQYPAANHTYILREVRQLRSLGFDIVMVSIASPDRGPEGMIAEEREEAAQTFYVKGAGLFRWLRFHVATLVRRPRGYFRGLTEAFRLARWGLRNPLRQAFYFAEAVVAGTWLMRHGVCHLHAHFSSNVALLLVRVFPITMSLTLHGPEEFDAPADFFLREKVQASVLTCAISNYGRSQILRNSPYAHWPKVVVSRLGVDVSVFAPGLAREHPSPVELLCVGRLAPVKAQHVLIDALAVLAGQGLNLHLRLVGDGPDRASLEQHVAARALHGSVTITGWLNQDQLREIYASTDLFVLPSFAEGIPVVLMEAMAMQIPCIATRVMGVPELIRDGLDGLLVDPADSAQLAEAVVRVMDDPALRMRLARAGRQRILECYDLRQNTRRLADLLRGALDGSRRQA